MIDDELKKEDVVLRKCASPIMEQASKDGQITEERIIDMLPHYLWVEKSNGEKNSRLSRVIRILEKHFKDTGILIIKDNEKMEKTFTPISDFPLFSHFLSRYSNNIAKEEIEKLFGTPRVVERHGILAYDEGSLIFVGSGTVTMEKPIDNYDFSLYPFNASRFFRIPSYATVTARSKIAHIWNLGQKKFAQLPAEIKHIISMVAREQEPFIGRLTTMSYKTPTERIKAYCAFLDEFAESHVHLTQDEIGRAIGFQRETVTKKKK